MSETKARRALTLLTAVNYLNYIDRYILAAVLASIKSDLGLSDFQAGLLATAFMIPYLFTAPIFGWLADTRDRSKILSLGVMLWSFATFLTGLSKSFVTIVSSRFLLGVGESAFTTTALPFLSDYYPKTKRGRVLAIFSSGLPVGAALGYVLGGVLSSSIGWRNAFYIVGLPGLILAIFVWKLGEHEKAESTSKFSFSEVLRLLSRSKPYIYAVTGYCAYTFVVGGVAHWIPTFMQRTYELNELKANTIFGGIAVGSGLVGTLLGGWLGDHLEKKRGGGHLRISSISMFLALPFFWGCIEATSLTQFIVMLVFTQFFFFLSTSPINVALLQSSPAHIRNSGVAIAIFMCHILGDAISSPLIGKYSDITGSLREGILICVPVTFLSAVLWWLGYRAFHNSKNTALID
jgi:predicted MFS family arabinose efflux permease